MLNLKRLDPNCWQLLGTLLCTFFTDGTSPTIDPKRNSKKKIPRKNSKKQIGGNTFSIKCSD